MTYAEQLFDKAKAEQDAYRAWLLTQPPEEILDHAYAYTTREDIVMMLENMTLSEKKARTLLHLPYPVTDIFTSFNKTDVTLMSALEETASKRAKELLEKQREVNPR